jgi:hypothetical protein
MSEKFDRFLTISKSSLTLLPQQLPRAELGEQR